MTGQISIGIDTGGTYTDAVALDITSHRLFAKAKALTTKGDLAVGVIEALSKVMQTAAAKVQPDLVSSVSISTTLATNAVVEGHGDTVAIVLIGFDNDMLAKSGIATTLPDVKVLSLEGGHDHNGDEIRPFDAEGLRKFVTTVASDVHAFAVAATFAVRNPAHEIMARKEIESIISKPVTLSSELSENLDAPRRAVTCALNARLISRITKLIGSVKQAMAQLGLDCPVMIVRGDGSLARADAVALRPIETVLSGPAASVIGAKWISGRDNFIMSDIGGTTTDIAVVENGAPHLAAMGAEVGRWRTMVRALDIKTSGLGGDSEIAIDSGGRVCTIGQRAMPVSLLGHKYPELQALLEADATESTGGSMLGRFVCLPFGTDKPDFDSAGEKEKQLLSLVAASPISLRRVALSAPAQRLLAGLRKKGLVQLSAFTPSDAAHVLGLQNNWSAVCARLAARLLCRFRDMREPDEERLIAFCREVHENVVAQSSQLVLRSLLPDGESESALCKRFVSGKGKLPLVNLSISPEIPIVAVGGPAEVFYPEVGKRLQTEIILAEGCDVANAIGAAAGQIAHRATVRVEGNGSGVFKVFGDDAVHTFTSGATALAKAHEIAQKKVQAVSTGFGAKSPTITVEVSKTYLPQGTDEEALVTASIVATAVAPVE